MLLEPENVVPIGARRGQGEGFSLALSSVESQNLFDQQSIAPAVHQQVVVAPDKVMPAGAELEDRKSVV